MSLHSAGGVKMVKIIIRKTTYTTSLWADKMAAAPTIMCECSLSFYVSLLMSRTCPGCTHLCPAAGIGSHPMTLQGKYERKDKCAKTGTYTATARWNI